MGSSFHRLVTKPSAPPPPHRRSWPWYEWLRQWWRGRGWLHRVVALGCASGLVVVVVVVILANASALLARRRRGIPSPLTSTSARTSSAAPRQEQLPEEAATYHPCSSGGAQVVPSADGRVLHMVGSPAPPLLGNLSPSAQRGFWGGWAALKNRRLSCATNDVRWSCHDD